MKLTMILSLTRMLLSLLFTRLTHSLSMGQNDTSYLPTTLRSVPDKLVGVISLEISILILMIMPIFHKSKMRGIQLHPINQIMFWIVFSVIILLTWIWARQ